MTKRLLFLIILTMFLTIIPHLMFLFKTNDKSHFESLQINEEWNMFMKTPSHSFKTQNLSPPLDYHTAIKAGKFPLLAEWFESLYMINNMLVDKNILIVSQQDTIKAYSLTDFTLRWRYNLPSDYQIFNQGGLAQNDKILFLGAYSNESNTGLIRAIDKKTQTVIWQRSIKGLNPSSPLGDNCPSLGLTLSDDKLAVTINGNLISGSNFLILESDSGKIIWEKRLTGTLPGKAIPTIYNKKVLVATSLISDSISKSEIYYFDLENASLNYKWDVTDTVDNYMIADDSSLYLFSTNYKDLKSSIYCIDLTNKKILWKKESDLIYTINLYGNFLYVSHYGGLTSIDKYTGDEKWRTTLGKENLSDFSTPVLSIGEYVLGGTKDGVVRILNANTGKEKQAFLLSNYIKNTRANEVNYVITSGNYVFCAYTDGRIAVLKRD